MNLKNRSRRNSFKIILIYMKRIQKLFTEAIKHDDSKYTVRKLNSNTHKVLCWMGGVFDI